MIDTHVPGDPGSVRAAAEWLSPTLRNGLTMFTRFCTTQRAGHFTWIGESGEAYHHVLEQLRRAAEDQPGIAADAAEKLRAYAGQLERMQHKFADMRDDAASGGLVVVGTVIEPPSDALPPPHCLGPDASPAQVNQFDAAQRAYERQLEKVELYNRIAHEVAVAWDKLEVWIIDNLDAFGAELEPQPLSGAVLDAMAKTNKFALKSITELKTQTHKANIETLRAHAETLRHDARVFKREMGSGNPAVREAARAADPDALRRAASGAESTADALRRTPTRHLPLVGDALSLGLAGQEIASGESPSTVVIGELGSVVGAAVGIAAAVVVTGVIGVTAPAWATAAAAVAGAWAIGEGGRWAYESAVPQDVREAIDAGLENAWDATTDFAEDAWSSVTDGVSGKPNPVCS
ncbi:hypothetical protein [Cellulomonas bogoriensis]|uniref:Uncharacterized protein n=1 Tax=Cellulomonas bogoriensis 69B4 = DSM 16987 TaxID=1386082 RepID=A0A0A0BY79_9CELL|nr:hypothetical protein [Cellulomonas bogoriensis]KGM13338.1 hypothetical protein N869_14835 [Cellulomonas bogoriensis 69B4 = DSM 16987]